MIRRNVLIRCVVPAAQMITRRVFNRRGSCVVVNLNIIAIYLLSSNGGSHCSTFAHVRVS